jgi:hypothetical protein
MEFSTRDCGNPQKRRHRVMTGASKQTHREDQTVDVYRCVRPPNLQRARTARYRSQAQQLLHCAAVANALLFLDSEAREPIERRSQLGPSGRHIIGVLEAKWQKSTC